MASMLRRRVGRHWGAGIAILGALVWMLLAFRMLRTSALDAAVVCLLLAACFLALAALSFSSASSARKGEGASPSLPGPTASPADELVEVLCSTDAVAIEILRGKLAANGIAAEIEGQHTSRMLGYLPVVPQRLMVPRADLALCSQILAENEMLN